MDSLDHLQNIYLAHHQSLGHSPKTIDHYTNTFILFHRFLTNTNHPLDSSALTTAVLQSFVAWLRETPTRGFRGNTQRTIDGIHGVMKDLRAFTRFLVSEELLDKQPKVPVPKLPQHLFPVLNEDEIATILTSKQLNPQSEIDKRNRALVAFMLDTGVRLSEVANLTLEELDLKEGSARVTGKGNKQRIVYFSDGVTTSLKLWLSVRGMETGSLFWLKPAGIRQVMERVKKETGLPMLFAHQTRLATTTQHRRRTRARTALMGGCSGCSDWR